MQRQLYPALLLIAVTLAAAVWMRPSLAKELIDMVRPGRQASPGYGYSEAAPPVVADSGPSRSAQPDPGGQSVPWPATARHEAVLPDAGQRYPVAGSSTDLPGRDQAAGPIDPRVRTMGDPRTSGPVARYPVAGSARARSAQSQAPVRADWSPPLAGQSFPYPVPPVPPSGQQAPGSVGATAPPNQPDWPPPRVQPVPRGVQTAVNPPADPQLEPCEGARILAHVGKDVILASEVLPTVDQWLAENKDQIPSHQRDAVRKMATLGALRRRIEMKLVYQDAKRKIPAERLPEIEKQIGETFDKEALPQRIKDVGVGSRRELDEKLRGWGTSLERERRAFVEQTLVREWIRHQDFDEQVSPDEMLEYYHQHRADYERPARARWEKLWVRIPRYSDGSASYAKLARMGNQVMQGASAADVLAADSGGTLPCGGGEQGWISQGSLEVSRVLEQAIFTLPVGVPSKIFKDGDRFCIVRVIEREEPPQVSFEDPRIQADIEENVQKLRRQENVQAYLARLKEQIRVWTVFDDDPTVAQWRSESAAPRR